MLIRTALAAVLALTAAAAHAAPREITAFPGAEGAGRLSVGGRGGAVIKVTNLEDAGPGSLRAAVEAKGPRTVLFEVAGTIPLKSELKIANGQITIAGQTAPGGGITLRDHTLVVAADDVVIRFIRSRLGDESKTEGDAIWINSGRRIILDHVSASWSVDETLSASARYDTPTQGFFDLTVQWSIIAESLRRSIHAKGDHGYGSLIRGGQGSKISFHHNLWANHLARMPRPGNYDGPDKDIGGAFFDFRSNVFYNWGKGHAGYNADKAALSAYNFVDNAYVMGPDSEKPIAFNESNSLAKAWFAGNSMNGVVPEDPYSLVTGLQAPGWRQAGPIDVAPVKADPAASAFERVLADAGASVFRDSVDARVVAGVRDKTGKQIDSQAQVGGWPVLPAGVAAVDTDGDGMPDAWEKAHGLDPKTADGAADRNGDGWTNLEDYLADAARRRGGGARDEESRKLSLPASTGPLSGARTEVQRPQGREHNIGCTCDARKTSGVRLAVSGRNRQRGFNDPCQGPAHQNTDAMHVVSAQERKLLVVVTIPHGPQPLRRHGIDLVADHPSLLVRLLGVGIQRKPIGIDVTDMIAGRHRQHQMKAVKLLA